MKEDDAPMTLLETENNITKAPSQLTSVPKDTLQTAAVTTPRRSSRRSVAILQNTPVSTTKRKCSMPVIRDVDSPVVSDPRSSLEESPPKKHCTSKSMLPQIENELIMDDSRPAKYDHTDPDENVEPTEQNLSAQLDASAVTNEGTVAQVENAVSTAHVSWDMPVAYKPKTSPAYEMEYHLESPISTKAGTQWTNTTCTRGTIHHVETAVLPPPQQHMVQSLCDKLPRNTPSRTAAKGLVQKRIAELEEVVVVEQDCRMRHITDKENMVPFTMVADDKPVSQSFATTTNRWEDSFSRHGAVYRDTAIKVKKSAGIPSWMMVLGVVALYLAILAANLPKGAYPGLLFRRNTMHGKKHQMTGAAKQSTVLNVVEPKPLQFKSTLKVVPSLVTPPLTTAVEEPELPVESKPVRFKPTLKVVPNPGQQSTTVLEPQTVLPLQSTMLIEES